MAVTDPYEDFILDSSSRNSVDPDLIRAVMRQESNGVSDAESSAGALGLMQLMPDTASELGVSDSRDPAQNIEGGTKYLRQMLDRYDGDESLALAAYNAGPGNVDKHGGIPPFQETQDYVQRISSSLQEARGGGLYDEYTLPDGQKVYFEPGTPDEEVLEVFRTRYPESLAFVAPEPEPEPQEPGLAGRLIGSAMQQGERGLRGIIPGIQSSIAVAQGNQTSYVEAQENIARITEETAHYNPMPSSFAEVKEKFGEDGIGAGLMELADLTAQSAGGSLGFMAPSLVMVGIASTAAVTSPVAVSSLLGGAITTRYLQYISTQSERGYHDGEASVEDINLFKQMALAGGQTGLETLSFGATGLLSQAIGKSIAAGSPMAKSAASSAIFDTLKYAKYLEPGVSGKARAAGVFAAESITETGQLGLERLAAEETFLPQTQADRDEYTENFVGALLGSSPFAYVGGVNQRYANTRVDRYNTALAEDQQSVEDQALSRSMMDQLGITEEDLTGPDPVLAAQDTNLEAEGVAASYEAMLEATRAGTASGQDIQDQKRQSSLLFLAEEENEEAQREAEVLAAEQVAAISGVDRTIQDVVNLLRNRNIDIETSPAHVAALGRFLHDTIGTQNLVTANAQQLELVYNRIAQMPVGDTFAGLPLTDYRETLDVASYLSKKIKKPKTRQQIVADIRTRIKKEDDLSAEQAYLDIRAEAVFNSLEANNVFKKKGDRFIPDMDTVRFVSDKEVKALSDSLIDTAESNEQGLYPSYKEARDNTGLRKKGVYDKLKQYHISRGFIKKVGSRYALASTIETDQDTRSAGVTAPAAVEYLRHSKPVNRWIVRDADGDIVKGGIFNNSDKEKAKEFVARSNATYENKLSEPKRERGFPIKAKQFKSDNRLDKVTTVDFIHPEGRDGTALADDRVTQLTDSTNRVAQEFLGTDTEQRQGNIVPSNVEATRLARTGKKADAKAARALLKVSPFNINSVLKNYGIGLDENSEANRDESYDSSWAVPFDGLSKQTKDSKRVVVKKGTYDENTSGLKGFGEARMNTNNEGIAANTRFDNWQEMVGALFETIATKPRVMTTGEVVAVPEGAGRTVLMWRDPQSDGLISVVLDYYDQGNEGRFHVYNAFAGNENYAEQVEDTGPLRDEGAKRGAAVKAETVWAGENPKNAKSLTPAEREAGDIGRIKPPVVSHKPNPGDPDPENEKTQLEENAKWLRAATKAEMEVYGPRSLLGAVNKVFDKWIGPDALSDWRQRFIDRHDPIERREFMVRDSRDQRMYADISAAYMARAFGRTKPMMYASLENGYIEYYQPKDAQGRNTGAGVIRSRKHTMLNRAEDTLVYNKDAAPGSEFQTVTIEKDVFNEKRKNATGGLTSALRGAPEGMILDVFRYLRARRTYNLNQEAGKPIGPHREQEMKDALELPLKHPEIAIVAKNVQELNNRLVEYLVATEVLSAEDAEFWLRHQDYTPFYLEMSPNDKDPSQQANAVLMRKLREERVQSGKSEYMLGDFHFKLPSKEYNKVLRSEALGNTDATIEEFFADPLEATLNNMIAALTAGNMMLARKRAIRNEIVLGAARPFTRIATHGMDSSEGRGSTPVKVRELGVDVLYEVDDEAMFKNIEGEWGNDVLEHWRNDPTLSWFSTTPAQYMREMTTRNPGFVGPNMVRDSGVLWLVNGGNPKMVYDTFKRAAQNVNQMRKGSESKYSNSYNELFLNGVIGGYEGTNIAQTNRRASKKIESQVEKGRGWIGSRIWDGLGEASGIFESAAREIAYEHVLKSAGDQLSANADYSAEDVRIIAEAEATQQAHELLNFNRKGDSKVLTTFTALAPFVQARMNGMDVIARAGFKFRTVGIHKNMRDPKTGDLLVDPDVLQKGLIRRGAFLMAASAAMAMYNYDDPDYERVDGFTRDENWLIKIPGTKHFIKAMTPFELGFFFKIIPEQIARGSMLAADGQGDQAARDMARAVRQFAAGQFGPGQLMPVVLRPAQEWAMNKSMHSGSPIVPAYELGLPTVEQYGPGTTAQGRAIAQLTAPLGIGPRFVDSAVRATSGGLGVHLWNSLDHILRAPAAVYSDWPVSLKAAPRMTDVMLARRFAQDQYGRGDGNELWEYWLRLDEAHRMILAANTPEKEQRLRQKYSKEEVARTKLKPIFDRVKEIKLESREIADDPHKRYGPLEKRRRFDENEVRLQPLYSAFKALRKEYDQQ